MDLYAIRFFLPSSAYGTFGKEKKNGAFCSKLFQLFENILLKELLVRPVYPSGLFNNHQFTFDLNT